MAAAQTLATGHGVSRTDQAAALNFGSDTELERRFVDFLKEHGYRLPDDQQVLVEDAAVRPDFVYRLPGVSVAVFVDGPVHEDPHVAGRDRDAEDRLDDAGWEVVRIAHDADWRAVVARHEFVFGPGATPTP